MPPNNKQRFWLKKIARRKTGFPIGTIAFYGPDDRFASKAVLGFVPSEKDRDITILKKWFSTGTDLRLDPVVLSEMVNLLEQHAVQRVSMLDRIIGCPHEEGIDYPMGEKCPQCPFWADKDRWTGETIKA